MLCPPTNAGNSLEQDLGSSWCGVAFLNQRENNLESRIIYPLGMKRWKLQKGQFNLIIRLWSTMNLLLSSLFWASRDSSYVRRECSFRVQVLLVARRFSLSCTSFLDFLRDVPSQGGYEKGDHCKRLALQMSACLKCHRTNSCRSRVAKKWCWGWSIQIPLIVGAKGKYEDSERETHARGRSMMMEEIIAGPAPQTDILDLSEYSKVMPKLTALWLDEARKGVHLIKP